MQLAHFYRRLECFLVGHEPTMVVVSKVAYVERCKFCDKDLNFGVLAPAEAKTPNETPKPELTV